jgi:hypothetical protein
VGACAHRNLQELTITKNPLNVHLNHSKRQNRPTLNRCTLGRDLRVLLPHPIAQRRCGAREKGSHSMLEGDSASFFCNTLFFSDRGKREKWSHMPNPTRSGYGSTKPDLYKIIKYLLIIFYIF